ncbi:hypothetical protein [Leptodesmis sp.]|uniref:hypothetical protein n=1 Tax=Leptodesmis sp. TaxID=3100501 RepID=UPI0040535950
MKHPFDSSAVELETLDLEFADDLALDELETTTGSLRLTTLALGEEGGSGDYIPRPPKWPPVYPPHPPIKPPIQPPEVTTLALGEEGSYPNPLL